MRRRRTANVAAREQAMEAMLADPTMAFTLASEGYKEAKASGDPLGTARCAVLLAEAINGMQAAGMFKDNAGAVKLLEEACLILERHLPVTRAEAAEAQYLWADSCRGRDWPTARTHYEKALTYVRRDSEPALWAGVNDGLAAALVKGPGGDEPDIQDRSISCYQEALSVEPPLVPPDHWAMTAHGLMLTIAERINGSPVDNWAAVVQTGDKAVRRANEAGDQTLMVRLYILTNAGRVSFGIAGLLSPYVPDKDALEVMNLGAKNLDNIRTANEVAFTPLAEQLSAAVRAAVQRDGKPVLTDERILLPAVEMARATGNRRAELMLHLMLYSAGAGVDHLRSAERLKTRHEEGWIQQTLDMVPGARRDLGRS